MRALFYENRLGIKKSVISFVYLCCPNTGTKFRAPYHSNHVIPHRVNLSYNKTDHISELHLISFIGENRTILFNKLFCH